MSGSDTEEKKHKPTATKLRRARREGNVPHAQDMLALSAWPLLLWLMFTWTSFEAGLRRMMTTAFTLDFNVPTGDLVTDVVHNFAWQLMDITLPVFVVAVIIAIVVAIVDNQGVIFAAKPITPDFNRLNPAEGFKRIFSARTAVESLFGLLKMAIFAGITYGVFVFASDDLIALQACGFVCLPTAWSTIITPLLLGFLAIFLIAAILDFLLSRELFRLDMKMSESELKRENKDVYGNPEIRSRRRSDSQAILTGPKRMGLAGTSLLFVSSEGIVGVRYVPNETPAPYVVLKAAGDRRKEILNEARKNGIPMVRSPDIAKMLFNRGVLGNVIPRRMFGSIAKELMQAGLV